ncbi:Uncharacterized protein PBTT_03302 [Plasmodiophora brassicae]
MSAVRLLLVALVAGLVVADHWGHDHVGDDFHGHGHDDHDHDHEDDVDDWHKHMNEVHRDVDGNLLHNNVDYDHIDDIDEGQHLEHERKHHHSHTPHNDLDIKDIHEDIVTPDEQHHVENELTEHHHRNDNDEHVHGEYGEMMDHGDMIPYLHDPAMGGQGHEDGVDADGWEAGHDHEHEHGHDHEHW